MAPEMTPPGSWPRRQHPAGLPDLSKADHAYKDLQTAVAWLSLSSLSALRGKVEQWGEIRHIRSGSDGWTRFFLNFPPFWPSFPKALLQPTEGAMFPPKWWAEAGVVSLFAGCLVGPSTFGLVTVGLNFLPACLFGALAYELWRAEPV